MNTEQTTFLGALITEYGNATFDCGDYDGTEEYEYSALLEKASAAKAKLLDEIAKLRHPPEEKPTWQVPEDLCVWVLAAGTKVWAETLLTTPGKGDRVPFLLTKDTPLAGHPNMLRMVGAIQPEPSVVSPQKEP